jgi:S-layer protein (TIGR01567 family)
MALEKIAMREKTASFALAFFILTASLAYGADSLEIRGPVEEVRDDNIEFSTSSSGIGTSSNSPSGFKGFFYDIDDDIGTEKLTVNIKSKKLNGSDSPPGLIYSTSISEPNSSSKRFEFREWGRYITMGFMGENYFVGYNGSPANGSLPYLYHASDHKNTLENQVLLKVLMDSDQMYLMSLKNPLRLKEGYELFLDSVDLHSKKAHVRLMKDGIIKKESVIVCDPNASMAEKTFIFRQDIDNIKNLTILAVYFDDLFSGFDNASREKLEIAQVDGIFQLSPRPTMVYIGSKYGVFTVTDVDSKGIRMINQYRTVNLNEGKDIDLIGGIRLRISEKKKYENRTPKFYIYSNITDSGTYEVRGPIATISKLPYNWSYADFPGFMYDLDDDLGTEYFGIDLSGSYDSGDVRLANLNYSTIAKDNRFQRVEWGSYYAMGWMGEQYFAGYAKNGSNMSLASLSDETNLLAYDKISRVLIDNDDEQEPLAEGEFIPLMDDYSLHIKEINLDKVELDLYHKGIILHSNQIVTPGNGKESTFIYEVPAKENGKRNMITLAVHFKNAYESSVSSYTTIDGIWQISDDFETIQDGPSLGIMRLEEIASNEGNMHIELSSKDKTIRAVKGKTKPIMNDYSVRFADQEVGKELRFYIMKNVTVGNVENVSSLDPKFIVDSNGVPIYKSEPSGDDNELSSLDIGLALAVAAFLCVVYLIRKRL